MPETELWEVVWYQALLMLAGQPVEPEVLEGNLTKEQAETKKCEWERDMCQPGNGVVVVARPKPKE